jgi:hypothetical protein
MAKYKIRWVKLIPVWTYGEVEIDEFTTPKLEKIWDDIAYQPYYYETHIDLDAAMQYPEDDDLVDDSLEIELEEKWKPFDRLISDIEEENRKQEQ